MTLSERFFVVRLEASEASQAGGEFEVQLLNANGQAKAVTYASRDADSVVVGDVEVDHRVILAAAGLPEGQGVYVNGDGEEIRFIRHSRTWVS